MADEILRSKHAFGSLEALDQAIADKKVDAYDILFLTDADGHRIGWIDKNGQKVILDMGVSADVVDAKVLDAIAKSNAYVDSKVEATLDAYLKEKYEITDVPVGTLVNYYDNEIRVMCPSDSIWNKQNVGAGGDPNCYYVTLKTYFTDDDVAGYIEHLGDQVDAEILKDIKIDENGRRYQPTWLAVAKYDEATGTWSYYGTNSTQEKFIGWDYRIDQYNSDNKMIASDCVRINLSNEDCHFSTTPFYVAKAMDGVDAKVDEAVVSANAYTDKKIAEVASGYEIVEF